MRYDITHYVPQREAMSLQRFNTKIRKIFQKVTYDDATPKNIHIDKASSSYSYTDRIRTYVLIRDIRVHLLRGTQFTSAKY